MLNLRVWGRSRVRRNIQTLRRCNSVSSLKFNNDFSLTRILKWSTCLLKAKEGGRVATQCAWWRGHTLAYVECLYTLFWQQVSNIFQGHAAVNIQYSNRSFKLTNQTPTRTLIFSFLPSLPRTELKPPVAGLLALLINNTKIIQPHPSS